MSVHNTPPNNVPRAGMDFSYATWSPGTTIELANVPWDSEYRDIVSFESRQDFVNYVRSRATTGITIQHATYVKPFQPIHIPVSFNMASQYNYVLVHNPSMPGQQDKDAWFGYFLNNVEFVAPGTTRVNVQVDAWNTFGFDAQLGRGFVERGHIGIAATAGLSTQAHARNYLTAPEGFELGSQYSVRTAAKTSLSSSGAAGVVVVSTTALDATNYGDRNNPVIYSATGGTTNGIPQGAGIFYVESPNEFRQLMQHLGPYPWISQGIVSATMVPAIDLSNAGPPFTVGSVEVYKLGNYPKRNSVRVTENIHVHMNHAIPARYHSLAKFRTYPYCFIEVTLFNGKPLALKPELLPDEGLTLDTAMMVTPPSPRLTVNARGYNQHGNLTPEDNDEAGDALDNATGIFGFPQLSVVNDQSLLFLANNAQSINFQHSSADWAQQRSLRAAQSSYDAETRGIDTMGDLGAVGRRSAMTGHGIAMDAAQQQRWLGMGSGVIGGAAMGGMMGGPGGAALGAAGGGIAGVGSMLNSEISMNAATRQAHNDFNTSSRQQGISQGAMAANRDANFDLANFAARGDYENTIAGINAKLQDAEMFPPAMVAQSGGDAFMYSLQNGFIVHTRIRSISIQAIRQIGEFWLRYGYAINRPTSLHNKINVMSHFTYWKVKELYLRSSSIPETFRNAIRGIFEKGVTVWRNPDDIGMIDPAINEPVEGVVL